MLNKSAMLVTSVAERAVPRMEHAAQDELDAILRESGSGTRLTSTSQDVSEIWLVLTGSFAGQKPQQIEGSCWLCPGLRPQAPAYSCQSWGTGEGRQGAWGEG